MTEGNNEERKSRLFASDEELDSLTQRTRFFDPDAPITAAEANLPHWQQDGTTSFVTFRLADSLPQNLLQQLMMDREYWLIDHPAPHSRADKEEFHRRFTARIEDWLDQGTGSRILELPECRDIVEHALRHFHGQRYTLEESVVAATHVHALVTPLPGHPLSEILHSWKSYTSKELARVEAASRRFTPWWQTLHQRRLQTLSARAGAPEPKLPFQRPIWQKESFDHIVRSPECLLKFRDYIRGHAEWRA